MTSDYQGDCTTPATSLPDGPALMARAAAESTQGIVIGSAGTRGLSRIESVNAAFTRITGFSAEEALRGIIETLLSTKQSLEQWVDLAGKLSRGEAFETTIKASRRDGTTFWAFVHAYPLHNGKPAHDHWVLSLSDVSAIHEPLLRLRESEERYRLLAENSRDLITIHRFDGLCIYASPAASSMLGFEPEELLHRPLESLFHPEDCAQIRHVLDKHFQNQPEHIFTHRLLRKDGSLLWCETTSKTTFDLQGSQPGGLIAITRDISKRRNAERELQGMHLLLSSVFESVPMGLCITGPGGRIIQCNQSFATTLGYQPSEINGTPITSIVPAEQLAPGSHEISCKRRHGEAFHAHLSITALTAGENANTLYTLADHTERDSLEARLREAQRLESLGTLAGGIAHDFNNLLAIILGYASLLRQVAPDNARIAEYGDTIIDAGRRGADVVRQLMMYANQHEPLLIEEDIHSVLANALVRTASDWPAEIRLDCDFACRHPIVSIDPEQIGRAIEHLLRNAREAVTGSGRVCLSTADRVRPQGREPAQAWLEIAISDNGCGMDEQTKSRIFEPFFSRNKGSDVRGLGLAIVYGIVKAHRGRIEVQSTPGKGTTVTITLPRPSPKTPPLHEDTSHVSEYKPAVSRSVLIVEDEPDIGRLWADLLGNLGWELHWARDGAEALALFEKFGARLDIVFSDIGLPGGIDGWEVCRRFRAARPELPILLASGYFKRGPVTADDIAEPVAYIGKPYQPNEVLRKLREMTDEAAGTAQ